MITSVINLKGGVAKTVTSIHLGATLASRGHRVLLIDMDLQAGLTRYLNVEAPDGATTADVMLGGASLWKAAQAVRQNLWVIPASSAMEAAELQLATAAGGEVRLRRALKTPNNMDYVFIDCPSGWGALTRNAVLASNSLLVPINSEPAAVQTAVATLDSSQELASYHDHDLSLLGVLLTRYRTTRTARAVADAVCQQWGKAVFDTRIRQAEKINELAVSGLAVNDVRAAGAVGEDYRALAGEVIARCQGKT
jgi:chromosome partitioning protein